MRNLVWLFEIVSMYFTEQSHRLEISTNQLVLNLILMNVRLNPITNGTAAETAEVECSSSLTLINLCRFVIS